MLYPFFFTLTILVCIGVVVYVVRVPLAYLIGRLTSHSREVSQDVTDAFHEGRDESTGGNE